MKNISEIPFRSDNYGTCFFVEENNKIIALDNNNGIANYKGLTMKLQKEITNDVLHFGIDISCNSECTFSRVGLRLGIDSYMKSYPEWNDKFFPTAIRCEKNGFWGCFCSPIGDILAIASPSLITSWSNEYNIKGYRVGHRIYTVSVDFVNEKKQPERHPIKQKINIGENLHYDLYFRFVESKEDLYSFVNDYAKIKVPNTTKFILEKHETELPYGRHIISADDEAQTSVYVRKDWFYYIDCARKDAEKSQQKPGTHVESWYGFYTLVTYAKIINDATYTKYVKNRFDSFLKKLTKKSIFGHIAMKAKADPFRLQNASGMISLLADMFELTQDEKYLDYAKDFAKFLMTLQANDGSYRCGTTHYTCVIYPAKSMLELVIAERKAGRNELADIHFESAKRAAYDLLKRLDNIQTEGQMTFEDGMISCEALQLAYFATFCDGKEREDFTQAAKHIIQKHFCLEQQIIPDCRTYGATLRFWEARYDINFFANMLNTPHGWTSWKNYATYYLYILTGEYKYLLDTLNTTGACMQVVDDKGKLNWAFVPDPCVSGLRMVKADNQLGFEFKSQTIGECYLSKISDWYRQPNNKIPTMQYIRYMDKPKTWKKDLGGSCDNDVHEHFKCLDETFFGKAFVHFENDKKIYTINCKNENSNFISNDKFVTKYIVRSDKDRVLTLQHKEYKVKKGINEIEIKS